MRFFVFLIVGFVFSQAALAGEPRGLGAAHQILKAPVEQPALSHNGDIESTVQQLMMEADKDAAQDLKDQMKAMRDANKKKQQQREQKEPTPCAEEDQDCLDDLGEAEELLRLQQALERKSKAEGTISNTMKKAGETQNGVINNLK